MIHERNFLHMEELASHGYIVFSLSAPYDSWVVIFPDGRIVRGDFLKANPDQSDEEKEREKRGHFPAACAGIYDKGFPVRQFDNCRIPLSHIEECG